MARQYLMQAVSSDSGELVSWISEGSPDFSGAAFPGPGTASEIAVAGVNEILPDTGPSDATPQPIGTPGAGTSDLYSRADHVHGMPTAAAHSLLTTGSSSGRVESVVTLGENEILGRATGGTLGGTSPQSFVFAGGGNLTLRVAPDSSSPITSLADSSQRNFIYSFADGYYHVTIAAIAKESTSGTYHDAGALVGVVSESGDLTIVRATHLPGSDGLTLDFATDDGSLVVTLGNETGDAITGRLHVGWMRQDLIP